MAKSESNFNKQLVSITPDSVVDMYEIDFSNLQSNFEMLKDLYGVNLGADPVYRFSPMKNSSNPVYWQGNAYQPLPVKMEGFESQSDGRLPRPTISIANPEGLLSKIVRSNKDFANCKITRKRTFVKFLDDIKHPYFYYIPDRQKDGYGATKKLFQKLILRNPKLVIMVDCGSTSNEAIDFLNEKKIKSLIIDHHEINKPFPDANSIINPKKIMVIMNMIIYVRQHFHIFS